MADLTVVSLNASVVHISVYVEMPLVAVNVSLAFGPFNSLTDAQAWADMLDKLHAQKQSVEIALAEEMLFGADGMPTRPYISMHMSVTMIAEYKMARKLAKYLLAPDLPETIEPLLAEYALRTVNEATAYSRFLFDQGK